MTRHELRDAVASSTGLTRRQIDDYVTALAEIVAERLVEGERAELMRLGSLRLRNRQKWLEGKAAPEILFTPFRWSRSSGAEAGAGDEPREIEPEPEEPPPSA